MVLHAIFHFRKKKLLENTSPCVSCCIHHRKWQSWNIERSLNPQKTPHKLSFTREQCGVCCEYILGNQSCHYKTGLFIQIILYIAIVQGCDNSIASTLELPQSCTEPSVSFRHLYHSYHILRSHTWSNQPSDAYMHQWTKPSLIQIMICHLRGANSLSKPVLIYSQ